LLLELKNTFKKHPERNAFCIDDIFYTYSEFSSKVSGIQSLLFEKGFKDNDVVLVYLNDDIDSYAAIFAIWFSGGTAVPINPNHPKDRQELLLEKIDHAFILGHESILPNHLKGIKISTNKITSTKEEILVNNTDKNRVLYVIFTSGSTGSPKAVPITLDNLTAYISENKKLFPELGPHSRSLQIFDLTFDASIQSYVMPLTTGACVYHVSSSKVKYLEAYRLMKNYDITFIKLTNSVLRYLKNYFSKITLPALKHAAFGGEALEYDLVKAWQICCPNAKMINFYGPTEATVNAFYFVVDDSLSITKVRNGIIPIGKPFGHNRGMVIDSHQNEVSSMTTGELCLSGPQITPGYLRDDKRNKTVFFLDKNGQRYYKTGDMGFIDADGDFIFDGRKDHQVKVNGHRIDLLEIEHTAKASGFSGNFVAICTKNEAGLNEIVLFGEKIKKSQEDILHYISGYLPRYMVPTKLISLEEIPLNANGKIDRKLLSEKIQGNV